MLCEDDDYDLRGVLHDRLELGNSLLSSLSCPELRKISGLAKLQKKIKQELKFLQSFVNKQQTRELRKAHLECSNLIHLQSVVKQILRSENVVSVLQPFNLSEGGLHQKKVCVDVVCDDGNTWCKVIARNPRALQLNSKGENNFGQRNILDQAVEFLVCSQQNVIMFKQPKVVFSFSNGVSTSLAQKLVKKGIEINGEVIDLEDNDVLDEENDESDSDDDDMILHHNDHTQPVIQPESTQVDESKLNLDITAMIAYVSNLTNGHADYVFQEKILTEQARWERENPVKPVLDQMFEDKELVCCESAYKDFKSIVDCLGGSEEKTRSDLLVSRLSIIPDLLSKQFQNVELCGKVKERSCAIFGTGDALKIITVTANSGFVRAARGQGINLAVLMHQSRALTEDKQKRAEKLSTSH